MKLVEIEDLEVGDEILISCQSYFKYLRILRKPALGKKKHWRTGKQLYKAVKCSTRRETKTSTWTRHDGTTFSRDYKEWEFGPDDHNYVQYIDLEFRQIVLVKKNEE
jgi:hypothetical protein